MEIEAKRLLADLKRGSGQERKRSFVCCWHANEIESEALWRIYCPPPLTGVAIMTQAVRLLGACNNQESIDLKWVKYINFQKSFPGINDRIFFKRLSLSHEAEVRAVIRSRTESEAVGHSVDVDLDQLLMKVVPSPFAPDWFTALLRATLVRYQVNTHISPSELLSEPFY